jgi:L-alanine-DL-glutamate epimerase-like enolase superfamily enzyme
VAIAVGTAIERLQAAAHTIPTADSHGETGRESDGTLEWDSTTIVVVEAHADGCTGLGYTYTDTAAAELVTGKLAETVEGRDALAVGAAHEEMGRAVRNVGRPGLAWCALSAVDLALWDLKARLLELPLVRLLDPVRSEVPVYGSGGFCTYGPDEVAEQLGGWVEHGIARVKMKVGRDQEGDPERVEAARAAIGVDAELYVDANGAYTPKEALGWAERYAFEWDVSWFEEPVSSGELDGLRLVRERAPAGLDIAAGEYAYVARDFVNLLGAVDCLQADVTRCGGITGFLRAGALAAAHGLDLSAHCAPGASLAACCAVPRFRHLEWFHDHLRVEAELFDGVPQPEGGVLRPNLSHPGNGLSLR